MAELCCRHPRSRRRGGFGMGRGVMALRLVPLGGVAGLVGGAASDGGARRDCRPARGGREGGSPCPPHIRRRQVRKGAWGAAAAGAERGGRSRVSLFACPAGGSFGGAASGRVIEKVAPPDGGVGQAGAAWAAAQAPARAVRAGRRGGGRCAAATRLRRGGVGWRLLLLLRGRAVLGQRGGEEGGGRRAVWQAAAAGSISRRGSRGPLCLLFVFAFYSSPRSPPSPFPPVVIWRVGVSATCNPLHTPRLSGAAAASPPPPRPAGWTPAAARQGASPPLPSNQVITTMGAGTGRLSTRRL